MSVYRCSRSIITSTSTSASAILRRPVTAHARFFASNIPTQKFQTEGEEQVFKKLLNSELKPTALEVVDTSGGCGTMYAIRIQSATFKGLPVLQQHRKVNQVLQDDIRTWHGVQLVTSAPKDS